MSPGGRRIRTPEVIRRQRTRRLDLTTALAVLLPLLTIGGLALVRPAPVPDTSQPPSLTKLTSASVVCPSGYPGAGPVGVSTASGSTGQLSVSTATTQKQVPVRTGAVSSVTTPDAAVVKGLDALAPGLVAARTTTSPVAGVDCPTPAADQWFSGLGARADHDSVIELANPDPGEAEVDVTLLGNHTFSSRRLHGITISGHKTIKLDLGTIVPRRPTLTAHVVITRGRLGVNVLDSRTNLVTHKVQREWVPRQLVPATDNELLGLPAGAGTRTLTIGNPTGDVVRSQVKIVTQDTSFVPAGMGPVPVPPGATITMDLSKVLAKALADGAVGVAVESTGAVTSSLTTSLANDQAVTVPDETFHTGAATLVPVPSTKGVPAGSVATTLLLSADHAGAADVTSYDASGKQLLRRTLAEQQGRTSSLTLPRGTAFVQVVPKRTPLRGAIVASGAGATVVPLHELLVNGLVPQIWPGRD